MNRLDAIFEEDIEMQDALENIDSLMDNSEDIIIGSIEQRYNEIEESKVHLFTNEATDVEVNDDGLTPDEEAEVQAALLDSDEDIEELVDDEDLTDLIIDDEE